MSDSFADSGGFGLRFVFGCLVASILRAKFVELAFDPALGESDHGVDEACELVGVGEQAFAEFCGVGFDQEFA
ncbi:MAG TPA: hypothetical protein VL361_14960 [Candidatus Limnocylindrales bacterium]|nr:hypothetical protein [Candidatus Limnocylindrales bacterium]